MQKIGAVDFLLNRTIKVARHSLFTQSQIQTAAITQLSCAGVHLAEFVTPSATGWNMIEHIRLLL